MDITSENHKIVHASIVSASTHSELKIIKSLVNSFLHDPEKMRVAGEKAVEAMKKLRLVLEEMPSATDMVKNA